jgi:hypothetical protein
MLHIQPTKKATESPLANTTDEVGGCFISSLKNVTREMLSLFVYGEVGSVGRV